MANILIRTGDEPVIIPAQALRRLLERGDGDAALLYLALLRHGGTLSPSALTKELRWDAVRTDAAETVLRELRLVAPDAGQTPEVSDAEPEAYQQEEVAFQLEHSAEFRQLTAQVESRLGKRLSPADLARLLELFNGVGLPSDVIYTLVNHCAEREASLRGPGRVPTMASIARVGVQWYNMGVDTQAAAAEYLKRYARRESEYAGYMRVLNMGERLPGKLEEKYLSAWLEWGFSPEAVSIAYEKTLLNCHEFKWAYCNAILKRWHTDGLHTVEEIERSEQSGKKKASGKRRQTDEDEIRKYVRQLKRKREEKKQSEPSPEGE